MKYIFLSIILHVLASLFLKKGAIQLEQFSFNSIATNYYYLSSIFCLLLQAFFWQVVLKKYSLNFAYIFTSLYYPLILLVSYILFKEKVTPGNIIGTLFIISGLMLTKIKNQIINNPV
jgi:drug/metabolite transporter (DMT)-like permease